MRDHVVVFERFSERARRVMVLAMAPGRTSIGTEHVLLGLLLLNEGVAVEVLSELGISSTAVQARVEQLDAGAPSTPGGSPSITPGVKRVLQLAYRESLQLGNPYLGTEHLLLGVIEEEDGWGARILTEFGADAGRVREQVILLSPRQLRREADEDLSHQPHVPPGNANSPLTVRAEEEARLLGQNFVSTEHLLLAALNDDAAGGAALLRQAGVVPQTVRDRVIEASGPGSGTADDTLPWTPRAKKVVEFSLREALNLGHRHIGAEHIVLGVAVEGNSLAAHILEELGADVATLRRAIVTLPRDPS